MKRIAIALTAGLIALAVGVVGLWLTSTGSADPAAQARAPKPATNAAAAQRRVPRYVKACLKLPPAERGACFAAAGGQVPSFVKACLNLPTDQRSTCFAAAAGAEVPGFVTTCLQMPADQRRTCFADAAGGQIPAFVNACLSLPPSAWGTCFRRHADIRHRPRGG